MAFNPRTITKELDFANLAKHNDNYADIKTELDAHNAHIAAQTAHGSTAAATPGAIMQRDSEGRAKVAAPAAADDIARKAEVDAVQEALDDHIDDADVHLSEADRDKLDGIEAGAEPNQNAFAQINNVVAASESDTLTIAGGTGIAISTNPTTKTVTVTATGEATPGPHGSSHDPDGSDPIPELVALRSEFDALTPESIGAETPAGAQAKVDALAGVGNTKTVAEVAEDVADVAAQLADVVELDDGVSKALLIKSSRNANGVIRVASFNYKSFRDNNFYNHAKVQNIITELACDVVGVQESWNGVLINPSRLKNRYYNEAFFGQAFFDVNKSHGFGLTSLSPTQLLNNVATLYEMLNTSHEQRLFTKSEINIGDKIISFYNTHLSYESTEEIESQLSQLYDVVSNDANQYKVIVGDFNTSDLSKFDLFTNNNFTVCNTNLPSFKPSGSPIDNIIITYNLSLASVNMYTVDDDISDHNIIYADISGV